jgi:hypothetical protein
MGKAMAKYLFDIESVIYPDDNGVHFDGVDYNDAVEWMNVALQSEATRDAAAATLAELQKRWAARQRRRDTNAA